MYNKNKKNLCVHIFLYKFMCVYRYPHGDSERGHLVFSLFLLFGYARVGWDLGV